MPHFYDFSNLKNIKEIIVNPKGWKPNIIIEYGIGDNLSVSYFWKIKGTDHTFTIPAKRIDFITSGNYEKHFEEVLENFREEYLEWHTRRFYTDWMREYREIYRNFIII